MLDEEKKALSAIRLDHAEECLNSAKALLEIEDYKGAANRSYYAIYHSMTGYVIPMESLSTQNSMTRSSLIFCPVIDLLTEQQTGPDRKDTQLQ